MKLPDDVIENLNKSNLSENYTDWDELLKVRLHNENIAAQLTVALMSMANILQIETNGLSARQYVNEIYNKTLNDLNKGEI